MHISLQKSHDSFSKVGVPCMNDHVSEINSFNPDLYECKDRAVIIHLNYEEEIVCPMYHTPK